MNKASVSSSVEGAGLEASKAFDGNSSTRWASTEGIDPGWIYVDLGTSQSINKVKLNWEAAYATSYRIQVSTDSGSPVNWQDVYVTTTGNGGIDEIMFTAQNAKYVRMYGTARGTPYGYSLFDFEVYNSSSSVGNIALNKPAVTSSIEGVGFEANKAFDGNTGSRWASALGIDPQWIYVNLGTIQSINRVKLNWEVAHATSYKIQVSSDSGSPINWEDVYVTTGGNGAIDDITFAARNAKYVRMYGTVRGTPYGYSLYEFEVFGP
ncbi:discoidin domain-containing protein [Cohnella luojiensis]|uniref:discoidin domain-containing protein n=1 Tax=Cohnella luojiensis TaxID=652876 RepID=UPI001F1121F8|nr:discoidin domain-containing protein [Cohnella luojiensis]